MMFRVFNGEHFQPETECWLAAGPICVIVNYPITIFGNFLVIKFNLFALKVRYLEIIF